MITDKNMCKKAIQFFLICQKLYIIDLYEFRQTQASECDLLIICIILAFVLSSQVRDIWRKKLQAKTLKASTFSKLANSTGMGQQHLTSIAKKVNSFYRWALKTWFTGKNKALSREMRLAVFPIRKFLIQIVLIVFESKIFNSNTVEGRQMR